MCFCYMKKDTKTIDSFKSMHVKIKEDQFQKWEHTSSAPRVWVILAGLNSILKDRVSS